MAKSPPPVTPTLPYEEIKWDYKLLDPISAKSKNRLLQLGMSTNGIAQLSTARTITSQKDMQIVAMLVSRALG
jgi:hypothetical protein